jgi:hypothetical protein
MDFLQKDLTPKTTGQDIMGQNGVKVIKGSGFNITDETYNATSAAESEQNANILKAFLSSAMINQGGKTGENVQRPAGTYHLHAVSANNSDKVAMTWEISPEWIKDHAGTDKSPGLTHKLNKDMGDGSSLPQITFIMDADKAASSPFKAMQMTKPEMIMTMTGSYDISSDNGNIQISKNAMGGYNYNGKVKAFNNGQEVEFPIFGTYNSEDFNALNNKLNQDLQAIDQGNLLAKNSFRANNPGTSYNLQQQ